MVADQAGTDVAGHAFLSNYLGLRVNLLMDPPHRVWNCEKLGLVQGDGWDVVSLLTLPFNINYGPWTTVVWLAQLAGAHHEYVSQFSGSTCPLFQAHLADIARERHLETGYMAQISQRRCGTL